MTGGKNRHAEKFRVFFIKLRSGGFLKKTEQYLDEFSDSEISQSDDDTPSILEISLKHVHLIFSIFFIGIIATTFSLMMEILIGNLKN